MLRQVYKLKPKPLSLLRSLATASRPKRNTKLVDISKQIYASVGGPLADSSDMLDEGLTYVREIQSAEGIPENDLQFAFKRLASEILLKTIAEKDLSRMTQVLSSLVAHNVAHKYHFTLAATALLENSADYHGVLSLWLQLMEYERTAKGPNSAYIQGTYRPYHLDNLVYFCYVQSCFAEKATPSFEDATKILQREMLPSSRWVQQTLDECGLTKKYSGELKRFVVTSNSMSAANIDPNGRFLMGRVESASKRKDFVQLRNLFTEMIQAAERTSISVQEKSTVAFMRAFLACDRPEEVFSLFQSLTENGVVPSTDSWHELFMAIAHPAYKSSGDEIATTIETMLASEIPMKPRILAAVVSAYANRGRFDDVAKIQERFPNVLLTATAKNNILVGHLLVGQVDVAEKKLQEYLAEGVLPTTTTMNNFLNAYAKNGNYAAVEGILKFMQEKNIAEDVATVTIAVDVFFKMHVAKGLSPDVDQILSVVNKTKSITFNDATYTALVSGLGKCGNIAAARKIFATAAKKYRSSPQLHTAMLATELQRGSLPLAEAIFEKHVRVLQNNTRMWNMMVSALLRQDESLALSYYERMKGEVSAQPNHFTYYFLLSHYVKKGNRDKIQWVIDEIGDREASELGDQLPRLLGGLGEYRMGERLRRSL